MCFLFLIQANIGNVECFLYVIPAKAGIQSPYPRMDSRLHGNDSIWSTSQNSMLIPCTLHRARTRMVSPSKKYGSANLYGTTLPGKYFPVWLSSRNASIAYVPSGTLLNVNAPARASV